jgi:hypothetical protein
MSVAPGGLLPPSGAFFCRPSAVVTVIIRPNSKYVPEICFPSRSEKNVIGF